MAGIFSRYVDDIPEMEFMIGDTKFYIQHVRCKAIANVAEHRHPAGCYELHLIKHGYGKFIVDGKGHNFAPGTLVFIGPGIRHQKLVAEEIVTTAEWVNIYAEKVTDTSHDRIGNRNEISLDDLFLKTSFWTGSASESIVNTFDLAIRELILKDPGYQQVVEACIKSLIVRVSRNFRSDKPIMKDSTMTALKYPVIMDDYFMAHYNALTLPDLSARLNLSERQTQRLIHEYYGMSFNQKKQEARMQAAKMLIETETNLSMSEIAIKLGFPSLEYFSSTFKHTFGISPREYKKSLESII